MARRSALTRDPNKPQTGGGLTQSLQRLSPGVYRDAGGRLTNQAGRPLPQQPMRQPSPTDRVSGPAQYRPGTGMQDVAGSIQGQNPNMVNYPAYLPPGTDMQQLISGITGQQNAAPGQPQSGVYWAPGYEPNAMQMPQPSANYGGKYRLSPGVYGTREQAMQQWQMNQSRVPQGAYDQVTPQGPSREQRMPAQQQPMPYEDWLKVFGNKRGTPV